MTQIADKISGESIPKANNFLAHFQTAWRSLTFQTKTPALVQATAKAKPVNKNRKLCRLTPWRTLGIVRS
jgi:hypothetical protein